MGEACPPRGRTAEGNDVARRGAVGAEACGAITGAYNCDFSL